ncbi:sulfopyruvate decarboxylase TPP-binding subunit [Bradyrhizobium sp. USDA 4516]
MSMAMHAEASEMQSGQHEVFSVLKQHNVKHIAYVPDADHSTAIRMAEADSEINSIVLMT